jgi:very-short-patch-repair endonuclease
MSFVNNKSELKMLRKKLRKSLTPAEAKLWNILKSSKLGAKFRRQHSIGKYILDFYCPSKKLGIELDGATHDNPQKYRYDLERDMYLKSFGLNVVHILSREVMKNLEGVAVEIKKHL